MTDNPKTQNIETAQLETGHTDAPLTRAGSSRLGLIAAFLLALTAMTAAALALWQMQQLKQSVTHLNRYGSQINALKRSLTDSQNALSQEQQSLEKLQTTLKTQSLHIETLNTALAESKPSHKVSDSFILQKVRFLLELSALNTHWTNDSQSSLKLLQDADAQLSLISSTSVYPLRQALATEINLWQSLAKLDTVGILSQLDEAIRQIDTLSIKQIDVQINPPIKNAQDSPNTWQDSLHASMALLQKLVIIRHHDTAVNPLISPMHEVILRDGIRLQLYEAQWAVLTQNNTLYQLALNNALDLCKKTFANNATSTASFIQGLTALRALSLEQDKPKTNTLDLVNQLIKQDIATTTSKQSTSTQS